MLIERVGGLMARGFLCLGSLAKELYIPPSRRPEPFLSFLLEARRGDALIAVGEINYNDSGVARAIRHCLEAGRRVEIASYLGMEGEEKVEDVFPQRNPALWELKQEYPENFRLYRLRHPLKQPYAVIAGKDSVIEIKGSGGRSTRIRFNTPELAGFLTDSFRKLVAPLNSF